MRAFSATHDRRLELGASLWSAATRRRSHIGDLAPKMLRATRAKSHPPQSDAGLSQSKSWRLVPRAIALVIFGMTASGRGQTDEKRSENLFDGKTLAGWKGNSECWRVEDGAIVGEIGEGKTLTKNEFLYWDAGEVADFDLSVEYRISGLPSANSGIQFRSARLENGHAKGFQADLDAGAVWLGRIYEEAGRGLLAERGLRVSIAPDGRRWSDPFPMAVDFKSVPKRGDWNHYEISARGPHVELRVNDRLFSALDDHQSNAARYAGKLAFQLHSGKGPSKIELRHIRLKRMGSTDVPPALAGVNTGETATSKKVEGFAPVGTNGKSPNLDFETGTLEGWKAEGDAWTGQPIKGDTVAPRKTGQRSNHSGQYWIGSYEPRHHDRGTGRLTSASFEVTHPWASFLIGGGRAAETRVEVVLESNGEILHKAHGSQLETMARSVVDLRRRMHQRIFVRLVDESKIGWGHLNFDDFVFHDVPPTPQPVVAASSTGNRVHDSPVLWHLRPNPAKPESAPAKGSGTDVVAGMMLTHGFKAELIAEEPAVRQPNAFTFDERGRLWVVEALGYPTKMPEGQGKDRILIFEDTKGDGHFDKRTVFMEGLNLVSGIEVGFGGVWIGAAPHLLFIPKDAEDRPGKPQVLLDGFGFQDTHETLNSFVWGPDGWLYGNQGVFNRALIGKPGAPDGERVELRAGVWRYHPVRHTFEIFAHGGSNQWGLDFNSKGDLFMTHCRSFHGGGGTTYVIRNGHYWNQANSNYAPFINSKAPAFAPNLKNFLPASARYDDGEGGAGKPGTTAIYGGHSHTGTMVYLGDNWPEIYRDHLFTLNLHGHQMNHQVNVREGSGYETIQGGYDLLYAPDPRYIGVALKCGPDGAVYIVDWCDTQHCHSPHEEKWDRANGRIYRVSWAQTYRPVKVDLVRMSDLELAELQTHPNEWYARTSRRLLMERGAAGKVDTRATKYLVDLLLSTRDESVALRAMWALHGLDSFRGLFHLFALAQDGESFRAWAVRLASETEETASSFAEIFEAMARSETSPVVRLGLASAMPALKEECRWKVAEGLAQYGDGPQAEESDRFLSKMIWYGLAPLVKKDLARAFAIAAKTPLPSLADSIYWYAGREPEGRERMAGMIGETADGAAALRLLQLLSYSLEQDATVPPPKSWPKVTARLASLPSDEAKNLTEQLSAIFGEKEILAKMRERLADDQAAMPARRQAFDLLKRVGDVESAAVFARLLDHPAFRLESISLLGRSDDANSAEALLRHFEGFNEVERVAALNSLTSRPALALPMLQAIHDKRLDKKHLTSLHIRQLRNLNHPEVNRLTESMWGKVSESSADFKAVIARYKKIFSEAPLWAYDGRAGKKVFERACAACHSMDGVGGKLGPDLGGSWRNGVDYFLENIVDPNAVVGEAFQLSVVTLTDGSVVAGMFEKETDASVMIRTIAETVNVAKAKIQKRQVLPQSLMAPGLLEAMPEREVIEMLKYLTTRP